MNKHKENLNKNKKIVNIITIFLYIISMIVYEFGFCNWGFTNHYIFKGEEITYYFSFFRVCVYIIFWILYGIGIPKFLDSACETIKEKNKKIIIGIYIPIMIAILSYFIIKNKEMYRISIFIIIFLMGIVALIYISKNYIKNIIVITMTLGMVFACTTRFNGSLDEKKHFMSAFNLAAGNINYVERPFTQKEFNEIPFLCPMDNSIMLFRIPYESKLEENTNIKDIDSLPAGYNPIMYIPSAIGIELAKVTKGSVADLYIAGRMTNLIFYAILLIIILKILPAKEKTFYVIYMLSFALLLAGAYSVDGIAIGIIGIFIAYCLNLYNRKPEDIKLKQILILMGLFAISLFIKNFAYIGVGFLVLLLPIFKIVKNNKKNIPFILGIILVAVILVILKLFAGSGVESDPRGGNTDINGQIEFLKESPSRIIIVGMNHIINTLCNFNWYLVLNPALFFGKFATVIMFLQFLFILYVAISDNSIKFKLSQKIISLVSFLLVFGSTSLILYLTYTEVGKLSIDGYQTRYILPILPLILMVLNNDHITENEGNEKIQIASISTIFIVINLMLMIVN